MAPASMFLETMITTVYVLTEHRLVREALVRMLQKRSDLSAITVELQSFDIEAAAKLPCSVVLTDSLHFMPGLDLLANHSATLKLVLFSMPEDPALFLEAVRFGASAYLLNNASASEIVGAVRAVCQNEAVYPPRLCTALMQYVVDQSRSQRGSSVSKALRKNLNPPVATFR